MAVSVRPPIKRSALLALDWGKAGAAWVLG
jgi:hypothetical protein